MKKPEVKEDALVRSCVMNCPHVINIKVKSDAVVEAGFMKEVLTTRGLLSGEEEFLGSKTPAC
jgi:hypothetical protein